LKINAKVLKAGAERYQKYEAWLKRQPLSAHSKRAYLSRINHFLVFLATSDDDFDDAFKDSKERDYILREYKKYLKHSLRAQPNSVNSTLTALDHFYHFLGFERTTVKREDLPAQAPQALTPDEQRKFLRAADRCRRAKDRAVVLLLIYTGIRISECVALDLDDVYVAGRKNRVIVRSGKGDQYREIPLNTEASEALRQWLQERGKKAAKLELAPALFLNPQGKRMSTAALDLIVRKVGRECGFELSAHVLRHTCLTNLVRAGHDLVLVAEIGGHRRLETTRRYSLPTLQDKVHAMESLTERA
jgi:site-specific recombinase XerD